MNYIFQTIGIVHSPYPEKFGIPRQPAQVNACEARLELLPPFNHPDMVRGLDQFSHLWVSFVFHQTLHRGWRPLVRPPRLGGNKKIGVLASRSTHRPNPLGLSLVRLLAVNTQPNVELILQGADLLDKTPVLDIKPYLPFIETCPQAQSGFVAGPPAQLPVIWSAKAQQQLIEQTFPPRFQILVEQLLAQDPRPAYQQFDSKVYGMALYQYNIRFQIIQAQVKVLEIE